MNICGSLFQIDTLSDFFVFPTQCFYFFWLLIFGFLFLFLSWTFYSKDEDKQSKGEILSSMGVSSLTVTFLALFGTFIESSQGVPMIQNDIFLWILAPTIIFCLLWLYNK